MSLTCIVFSYQTSLKIRCPPDQLNTFLGRVGTTEIQYLFVSCK